MKLGLIVAIFATSNASVSCSGIFRSKIKENVIDEQINGDNAWISNDELDIQQAKFHDNTQEIYYEIKSEGVMCIEGNKNTIKASKCSQGDDQLWKIKESKRPKGYIFESKRYLKKCISIQDDRNLMLGDCSTVWKYSSDQLLKLNQVYSNITYFWGLNSQDDKVYLKKGFGLDKFYLEKWGLKIMQNGLANILHTKKRFYYMEEDEKVLDTGSWKLDSSNQARINFRGTLSRAFLMSHGVTFDTILQFKYRKSAENKSLSVCLQFQDSTKLCHKVKDNGQVLWKIGKEKTGLAIRLGFVHDGQEGSAQDSIVYNIELYDVASSNSFVGCYLEEKIQDSVEIVPNQELDECRKTCGEKKFQRFGTGKKSLFSGKQVCRCIGNVSNSRIYRAEFDSRCDCTGMMSKPNSLCVYGIINEDTKSNLHESIDNKIHAVSNLKKSKPIPMTQRLLSNEGMPFSRSKLEFSLKGEEQVLDSTRTSYPDEAYSESKDPFASITLEGTLDLIYNLNPPIAITADSYLSFTCRIPQDVGKTGICLSGNFEACFWTGGGSLTADDHLKPEYGGIATALDTDFRIYLGDADFNILNTDISTIKIVQEAISDNVIRDKQNHDGYEFDFIQESEKNVQKNTAGEDDTYQYAYANKGYFACGLNVNRDPSSYDPNFQFTGTFDLRVKWCNYEDWQDQLQTSSSDYEMCEEDAWIFALRAANVGDATPYATYLASIEFLCIDKDWRSITKKAIDFAGTKFSAAEKGWCKNWDNDNTSASDRVQLDGYFTSDSQCLEKCVSDSSDYLNVRGCQRDLDSNHCFLYYGTPPKDVVRGQGNDGNTCWPATFGLFKAPEKGYCVESGGNGANNDQRSYLGDTGSENECLGKCFDKYATLEDKEDVSGCQRDPAGECFLYDRSYWKARYGNHNDGGFSCWITAKAPLTSFKSEFSWGGWAGFSDAFVSEFAWSTQKLRSTFSWVPCGKDLCNDPGSGQSTYANINIYDPVEPTVEIGVNTVKIFLNKYPVEEADFLNVTAKIQTTFMSYDDATLKENRFPADVENKEIVLTDLQPGKRYDFMLEPVDTNLDRVTSLYPIYASVVVPCSCEILEDNGNDLSGKPLDIKVTQVEGFIYVQFVDGSQCEEAFTIQRKDSTGKMMAYSPSYYYYLEKVCGDTLTPGSEYADDLSRSLLTVGETYEYCVSAAADNYIAQVDETDNTDTLLPFQKSSNPSCISHKIMWEASLMVFVSLKKDAGGIPIRDAVVSWALYNADNSVVTTNSLHTPEDGTVYIKFKLDGTDFDNDKLYKLVLKAEKQTGNITHTFLCDDETRECPGGESIVHIRHLEFNKKVSFADDSSIPIQGKIIVAGTEDDNVPDGCTIQGATVCLNRKAGREMQSTNICTESDYLGLYELSATIGTVVSLTVKYHNHTFEAVSSINRIEMDQGLLIESTRIYNNYDFQDTNKTQLVIDVAGGLCNKTLGTSSIELKVAGCDWVKPLSQDGFRQYHLVPAQLVEAAVTEVKWTGGQDLLKISEFFNAYGSLTKDLREVDQDGAAINSTSDNETQTVDSIENRRLRFQYDGELTMKDAIIVKDEVMNSTCTTQDLPASCDANDKSCSNNVITTGKSFVAQVLLVNELVSVGGTAEVTCDIMDNEISAVIINNLGLNPVLDSEYFDKLIKSDKYSNSVLELVTKCTGSGCSANVKYDIDETTKMKSRARIEELFMAGRPTVDETDGHKKTLSISSKGVVHEFRVVITGDYEVSGSKSFQFPTYHPLLLIRDPPGGDSYVSYENVQSTIHIRQTSMESYIGFENNMQLSPTIDVGVEMCGGFGVMVCNDLLKTSSEAAAHFQNNNNYLVAYDEETKTHSFTSSWSYETSQDPEFAGSVSDVVLVPNIDVKFVQVQTVSWDSDSCEASVSENFVYNLQSPDNVDAFAFYTLSFVTASKIPELERIRDDALEDKQAAENKTEGDRDADDILAIEEYNFVQEALDRWELFVQNYEDTNNNDDLQKINHWFSVREGEQSDPMKIGGKLLNQTHWSGVVPKDFDDSKKDIESSYTLPDGVDTESFDKIARIQFTGGGGGMEITLTEEQIKEVLKLQPSDADLEGLQAAVGVAAAVTGAASFFGPFALMAALGISYASLESSQSYDNHNKDWEFETGVDAEAEFSIGGFGMGVEGSIHYQSSGSERAFEGPSTEKETSITVFLGDPDSSDEFSVDIFLDPVYNTFVFKTISGISACPWEGPPLTRLEDPRMEIVGTTAQNVPGDLPIIFNIKMWNQQNTVIDQLVPLEVILDPSTNTKDLRIEMFGTDLQNPQQMNMYGSQPVESKIAIYRGPADYEYPPIKISFRSQCEAVWPLTTGVHEFLLELANDVENGQIKFSEPCPAVRWAGDILFDQNFLINKSTESPKTLQVSVFNLNANNLSLNDETEGRLKQVYLKYRKLGSVAWNIAKILNQNDQLVDADYAQEGIEDDYGYGTLGWAFQASQLKDGDYEIIVQSICEPIPNAPAEYNSFSTSIIEGTVDRESPSVFGQISFDKSNKKVFVKGEIEVNFSEDILCKKPYTFSIDITYKDWLLDNDNLKIKCSEDTLRFVVKIGTGSKWVGKKVTITITDVYDLANNIMNEPYSNTFRFVKYDPDNTNTLSSGRMLIDNHDSGTKHVGCDGIDQNRDGSIDDCEEDDIPPSLSIHSVPLFSNPRFPEIPVIKKPVFSTVKNAEDFLLKNLVASDDCAADLNLDISSPSASCDTTLFEVTVTDPRCAAVNPTQTLTKSFLLHVDDVPPTISAGFHTSLKVFSHHSNEQILFVHESNERFVNVFWYEPKDNCPHKLKVDVRVRSNENSYGRQLVLIRKKDNLNQGSKLQVYVEPSSCKIQDASDAFCEWNPDTGIRFYEINVKAVDLGGNVASTTVTVVVVPKAKPEDLDQEALKQIIAMEPERFVLETAAMEWNFI